MEDTWSTYKVKPATRDLYTDEAVVIYVPTGAGARGASQIRRFYLQPHFKATTVKEEVHSHLAASGKIMEEVEWTITFDGGECSWLVPTLDEGLLMNATVKIPVVISATFEGSKISVLRVYWDQASVLKQLRVVSERNKWPVRGSEQVDVLRAPQSIQLNPFAPEQADLAPPVAKKNIPVKAIDAPGRCFGPVAPEDEVSRPVRRPAEQNTRNIFTYQPPPERPLVSHDPNRFGHSFSFGQDGNTTTAATTNPTTTATANATATTTGSTTPASSTTDSTPTSPETPTSLKPAGNIKPVERNIFGSYDVDDLSQKTANLRTSQPRSRRNETTYNIFGHE